MIRLKKLINGCEILECYIWSSSSPGVVLGLPPRGGFGNNPSDDETWSHLMPCRNPCRLYINLAFTHSVCPSSELGPALPFPPTRVLKVQWPRALGLMCEVDVMDIVTNLVWCLTNYNHPNQCWIGDDFYFIFNNIGGGGIGVEGINVDGYGDGCR